MKKLIKALILVSISFSCLFTMSITANASGYKQVNVEMKYYSSGKWNNLSNSVATSNITGLRLTTTGGSYYFKYRTYNKDYGKYYSYVDSRSTSGGSYAGTGDKETTQRNIQCVDIDVYSTADDSKITTEIVVIYRVKTGSGWLKWVSNAPAEQMQLIKNTFSLDGELDTVSTDAGTVGKDITGLEIRVYALDPNIEIPIVLSGTEQAPVLKYALNSSTLIEFNKKTENQEMISAIQISTPASNNYYLSYQVSSVENSGYYSTVKSTVDDYAGVFGKPIDMVKIDTVDLMGNNITKGVVVLYRVYTDRWLAWVSNASPEYMNSVKLRYNIAGQLDTKSGYAGVNGTQIKGIEIRIFEESELMADCGNSNEKALNVPYISQVGVYPTGCESVSTVMALNNAGNSISVSEFINNYLDKSPYIHNFNPNECFGGDPTSETGMGCYVPAIKKALAKFLPRSEQYSVDLTDSSLEYICQNYIDKDIPVVLWATQGMKQAYNVSYPEGLQWIAPEHCLLLTGYDDRCYIFNDPLVGANVHYLKADVENAYKALGYQSLAIMKKTKPATPEKPQIISNTASQVVLTSGYEYSLDGITWQSENTFNGILNDTVYFFYIRIPATETSLVSDVSEPLKYIKSSPVTHALAGATKIAVDREDGFEYSLDNINWQSENIFTGLTPNKEYKIYKRIKSSEASAYADEKAFKIATNGRDLIENPTAAELVNLKRELLMGEKTDLACDLTGDNQINILDLIKLKKITLNEI